MSSDEIPLPRTKAAWGCVTAGVLFVLALIGAILFWTMCITHIENYELGYKFDSRDGTITMLPHAGYVITAPVVVDVYTIDLRPMQICVSSNERTLNCQLVKFNPEGFQQFIKWHGAANYDASKLKDILMSYAYEGAGHTYPFLEVMRVMTTEDLGKGDVPVIPR